jgi:hypothetical protein
MDIITVPAVIMRHASNLVTATMTVAVAVAVAGDR